MNRRVATRQPGVARDARHPTPGETSVSVVPTPSARAAFLGACALDVAVRKPGNVSAVSPGHGMDAGLFLASARAAEAGLFAAGASVGERIEAAVAASLAVAGCNTNLGIVLLCAPLALAFERGGPARRVLQAVLGELALSDATAAFRAIAAARPGGLGRTDAEDVSAAPTVNLLEAMTLAAGRDRIARQYASGYADLWEIGLPALAAHATPTAPGRAPSARAVQALYLAFLGRWPDSHLVRKFGTAAAQRVTDEAGPWLARAEQGEDLERDPAFAAWDTSLKARGLNPGTSADLVVATLFLAGASSVVKSGPDPASP